MQVKAAHLQPMDRNDKTEKKSIVSWNSYKKKSS